MLTFALAPDLRPIVRPACLWLAGATVIERDARMDAPIAATEAALRAQAPADVTAVRAMYKAVGIDPTKTRPSSEALLRRIRKGEPLPRINSMVDVCNWCSAEFGLPYGLYDTSHVAGSTVEMRLGSPGESYPGIRKDAVHVGGRICVADAGGAFGNPTSDSARTMVTTGTTGALLIIYAPAAAPLQHLQHAVDVTTERMRAYTGAAVDVSIA